MTPIRIYWAGALFDFKELLGNRLLADAVRRVSAGRYFPVLPQEGEAGHPRDLAIRDLDLDVLLSCDAILAHFDGTELDSGTVAEFFFAKMLGMPSVLFRSDFRIAGEEPGAPEPWNLMCKGYPRSVSCVVSAMALYRESGAADAADFSSLYCTKLAGKVVESLDQACALPPIFSDAELPTVYRHVLQAAGGKLRNAWSEERLAALLERKKAWQPGK